MQTRLIQGLLEQPALEEAQEILRSCVHCGFCNATCPTYQELGDELDGPRGRIYQIKELLEGTPATRSQQQHLDRCLTCLNCETTCPSGVRYGRLLEHGRTLVERHVPRPLGQRLLRWGLLTIVPYPKRFRALHRLGRLVSPLLPAKFRTLLGRRSPFPITSSPKPAIKIKQQWLLLSGCVQETLAPGTHYALRRLLEALGIGITQAPGSGCCGALAHHLPAEQIAKKQLQQNIDAWAPLLATGYKGLIVAASGCGAMIRGYSSQFQNDPHYAEAARQITQQCKDPIEILEKYKERLRPIASAPRKIAFHPPCTLQHAMKMPGRVESLLQHLGFELTPVPNAHLCCGSAGSYSLFQANLAQTLGHRKKEALLTGKPDCIATANIGCQHHLQQQLAIPVVHWLELLEVVSE